MNAVACFNQADGSPALRGKMPGHPNMIQFEHYFTTTVNFTGTGLGPGFLLLKTCATGAEASRVLPSVCT